MIKKSAKLRFFLDMCKKSSTFVPDFEKIVFENDKTNGYFGNHRQARSVQAG